MAGGPLARVVPCMRCAGPASRVVEGVESDQYACDDPGCGERFGIDWRGRPAEAPEWPVPEEVRRAIREASGLDP